MANLVITWDANPQDIPAVYDEQGELVAPAVQKDKRLKITYPTGQVAYVNPGVCTSLDPSKAYSIEVEA